MAAIPQVKTGEWISLAEGRVRAVVCTIYDDSSAAEGRIEIVYLDDRDRAINEDAKWDGNQWVFVSSGPVGGYADNYDRLSEYVSILRGRHRR